MKNNSLVTISYYESYFYFLVWLCAIIYSVYQFYLANNYFSDYNDIYSDFDSGWSWIGKKRDTSDQEWLVWLTLINQPHQYWNCEKFLTFMLNLIRYMFWCFFTELLLHFIYVNAIQYHLQVLQNLNSWELFGLGYCMGQFFFNKYVVIYGTCSNLCYLDDIKAPSQPKCIARIHLYSDMWKHFDRGLYKFLIRYIYVPIRKSNRCFGKLFASFLCFTFVFMWHGIQMNIFIWALLNFIGIVIEDIGTSIGKSKQYYKMQNTYLSSRNTKRLHCILASPLLAMSAISNFYFLGGQDIGNIFTQKIIHGTWKSLFILLFLLYCCCQVSVDIKRWELRHIKR
ncbi:PREDICTED: protein-cysteine N-palmitoyltransferase Rasp isoform X1 [Acromyrmex echinatior]|uniref:protein-cysteine N-palmitoyltransferase Rasp isoform X1 n=1 Tax=Acromyrmex echinatior TaxID=103372 RepID=UPI000580B478|nr:PREDICTED: protein-cysteine N-palmitoyltransferase Rasp isoform X1 [Acromyrmex echinatior]